MSEKIDDLVKILIKFSLNKSKTKIEDYFDNTIYPKIKTEITKFIGTKVTNLSLITKLEVTDIGNNIYTVYPRIFIKGDTNDTRDQRKTNIDTLIDKFNILLETEIVNAGGTVIMTHLCYRNKESVTRWV